MSTTTLLALLTVALTVVVIVVLASALIVVRQRLARVSIGLATLADALEGVEEEHLRPLEGAVKAINAQFEVILGALPASPARRRSSPRGGRNDALVDRRVALLVVVFPVVVYLLNGVLSPRRASSRAWETRAEAAAAASQDLDATALLLTTQEQVAQTVAGVAGYGGSLDVIIDDAS